MVTVQEAFQIVLSHRIKPDEEEVYILSSLGRVLAESVYADRDFPPFSRVAMDGIAIDVDSFSGNNQVLSIEDVQAAGSPPLTLSDKKNCIEVMTGAVLPENTNAVIRYEDLEIIDRTAKILLSNVERGANIHRQAQDARKGDELLKPGLKISPAELALLSSVGKKSVKIYAFPKTAVVSSGDELVEIEDVPLPHQIRKSNSYALQGAMNEMGWNSESFHLIDDYDLIKKNLRTILENDDVLILSGGVSKGKFDFIPQALEELGIQKLFHQVRQRPGKPFWFGASSDKRKIVFALPGNPVSTFLCFHRYIRPWMMGCFGIDPNFPTATLASDFTFNPTLTYYLQVRTESREGMLLAHPVAGGGSGDFANLSSVDGFLELPLEKSAFKAGEVYSFIPFR